jgi:hypothetical protein
MLQFLSSGWLLVAVPLATSLLCLAAVLGIASQVRMNKGAAVNYGWILIALGLLAMGASEMDRVLAVFGLPNLAEMRDLIRLSGALLIVCGIAFHRNLLRRLVR